MRRKVINIFVVLFSIFFFSGCTLKKPPSALQIDTTPSANVLIEGKLSGKTPYQASDLKAGEVTVKLIPESSTQALVSWEGKVKLNTGVLTLIQQEFASAEEKMAGQILTLEKIKDEKSAALSVVSNPDGAMVSVDGEARGFTPLLLDKVGVGDHQILISKDGFGERLIKAKTVLSYKLIINAKLAQAETPSSATPSATPTLAVTPKTTVAPKPTVTGKAGETTVKIKDTPTGFLRVRKGPSTAEAEIAKVNPGETYTLLEEKSGWYKISLADGTEGWISSSYASKI